MRILCGIIFLAVLAAFPAAAMNHNLLSPWQNPPRCSPPQTPLFAFFNRENADFMFKGGGEKIEIWCQAGIRTGEGLKWSLHHNQLKKPFLGKLGTDPFRRGDL